MGKMETTNFMTAHCSWFKCYKDNAVMGEYTFSEFFSLPETTPPYLCMTRINDARKHAKHRYEDTAEMDAYNKIKSSLPCLCVSGTFQGTRNEINLISHTGFICIDIDSKDNPHITDWEALKHRLSEYDCIAYCALSLSGDGLFCIIPIDKPLTVVIPPPGAEGRSEAIKRVKEKHVAQFRALKKTFQILGLKIDESCKDLTRLRVLSYDPRPYINTDAVFYPHMMEEEKKPKKHMPKPTYKPSGKGESLPEWLTRHGVDFVPHGERYMIDCPWEALHSSNTGFRQTCVWEDPDGQWCFHCFHSHCSGKGWKDYRKAVSPSNNENRFYRDYKTYRRI